MAQQNKIGKTATSIFQHKERTYVQYHETIVVSFDEKSITLNSGGWRTQTTKNRINQASNQFGLGFHVFQKDGDWFVRLEGGGVSNYLDEMIIYRR